MAVLAVPPATALYNTYIPVSLHAFTFQCGLVSTYTYKISLLTLGEVSEF